MARPKKLKPTEAEVDLKTLETIRVNEIKDLYKDLAILKEQVSSALHRIGQMDDVSSLSEATFKAGRAYEYLNKADDKLESMLDNMYEIADLDHWSDILDENF
jgi:hypothetical protein